MLTPNEIIKSPIYLEKNYGTFDIPTQESDIAFYGSIRGLNGKTFVNRYYTKSEIAFDQKNLRFDKMCSAKGNKQKAFRLLI